VVRGMAVGVLLALIGWGGYEGHGNLKAYALRDRLLDAKTNEVPTIVQDMAPYRRWLDPLLRDVNKEAEANQDPGKQLHTSLALLPVDATQVAYLFERLLKAEPQEVPVIRDSLASYKDALVANLWAVVEKPENGKESQRLRAASALAKYDPASERWAKVRDAVANDLVNVPPVYLATWMESLRPVRGKLLKPLQVVYGNGKRRETERSLATDILADYASDQLQVLADLLMDADEKQFAVIYPKFKEQGAGGQYILTSEFGKALPPPAKTNWTVRFHKWESVGPLRPPANWEAVLRSPILDELRMSSLSFPRLPTNKVRNRSPLKIIKTGAAARGTIF
jgi:eukaryotic-like serine/threonine-protein kinase